MAAARTSFMGVAILAPPSSLRCLLKERAYGWLRRGLFGFQRAKQPLVILKVCCLLDFAKQPFLYRSFSVLMFCLVVVFGHSVTLFWDFVRPSLKAANLSIAAC